MSTKIKKNKHGLNTLKVLLRSLRFQLDELNEVNQKIDNLKSDLNGGVAKEREKR